MIKAANLVPLLNVADAARSIEFYRDVLGFEIANQMEAGGTVRWARLQSGAASLMVNQPDGADSRERRSRDEWYGDAIFCFDVDDAREARADLAGRGFDVDEPKHEAYGWEFHLRDPDGYALAFTDTK